MMNTYRFRFYTGPTTVAPIAAAMRAVETSARVVAIEGTEHIHVSVRAANIDRARNEIAAWLADAQMSRVVAAWRDVEYLGSDSREQEAR